VGQDRRGYIWLSFLTLGEDAGSKPCLDATNNNAHQSQDTGLERVRERERERGRREEERERGRREGEGEGQERGREREGQERE